MKQLRLVNNGKAPFEAGAFDGEAPELIAQHIATGGNVGTLTGRISGIVVIDIDRHGDVDGVASFKEFLDAYAITLPKTRVVKTPNDGLHYYFKLPEKWNDTQFHQNIESVQGVDFQAHGRFVVAPPSIIDGKPYQFINDVDALPEIPEVILEIFKDKAIQKENNERKKNMLVKYWEMLLDGCPEGGRNIFMTKVCGLILAGEIDKETAWVAVQYSNQIACNPPLELKELRTLFDSVNKREQRRKQAMKGGE